MKIVLETIALLYLMVLCKGATTPHENKPLAQEEEHNTDLFYFSFNKETYDDFKCNINDEILTHISMYKPPFYKSKSIRNFLSTLCLFFQYSELKKNDFFRNEIEELFKMYSLSLHYLNDNDIAGFTYNPDTFKDRLIRLDETIKSVLEEQNLANQIVSVKEENGRYIVTQKCSLNNSRHKIVEEGIKEFTSEYLNNEVLIARYAFETKMYEFFLEGLLGENYANASASIIEKYNQITETQNFETWANLENLEHTTSPKYKLLYLFNQYIKLVDSHYPENVMDNVNTEDAEAFQEDLKNKSLLDHKLAAKRLIYGEVPDYLYDLTFKNRVNVLFIISESVMNDLDIFSRYPSDYIDSMLLIKDMLNNCLKDSKKIVFDCQLSDESINNLVKICLELVL